jgi:outer membrane protein
MLGKSRRGLLFALIVLTPHMIGAEQEITRVGVVDTSRIYSVYFQDSRAIRELEEFKQSILEESEQIQEEILELRSRKVQAERDGNKSAAVRLDGQILQRENFLREYQRVKNLEYRQRQSKLELESSFLTEVADAIAYIAVSEGYSIILEKQNPIFLYYTVETDVTEEVLEYLFEQSGRTYSPGQ